MTTTTLTPIQLQITESGPSGREFWPLTRGVPLPEGSVHAIDELALLDSDGQSVPVQLRPLSRWPDGSLKWVLTDFHGHADTTYELVQGTQAPVDEAVQVEDTGDTVEVCTGPLRFTVRRDRVGLFENLQLGTRSQGVFSPTTTLTGETGARIWARIREGESFGGTRRRIYGLGGECRASLAPDDWTVEIEEAGPLRTVITCRGALELYAPMHHYAGYRPLRFVLRIHAFAGRPFVRLQHTIVFCLNPRETEVEELGLHLPLAAGEGPFSCRAEQVDRVFDSSPGGQLLLAQKSDNHYRLLSNNGSQSRVAEGERTSGWLTREQEVGGLGVALHHMAEEYPKALRATGEGGIDALPWHDPDGGRLNLTRYAEEVSWHEGEGVYADGTGTAKTTELSVTWFEAGGAEAAIDDLQRLLDPPHVAVAPAHMAHCAVTGGFEPASARFPRSERMLTGFVDWLSRQIRLGRWYGFFDFGDALVAWEEATNNWRFNGRWGWCNSEWDPRHGVWIQYLRTGDPALFRLGEAMTRHSVDVDTCHWHGFRPYFVGGGYRHSVDHFGDEPCASHTFIDNWVDHYYLTGDLRTLQVLQEAGEFLRRYRWTEDPQFSFSLRSIANTLRGLLYAYEVTGDESLMQRATQVYEVIARGQNDDGSWHKRFQVSTADRLPEQLPYGMASEGTTFAVELGTPAFTTEEHLALRGTDLPIVRVLPVAEQKGYQTHYLLIGIELFHRLTGRDDVADVYRRAVDWFCGAPGPLGAEFALQQHYGGILCRHLARTWRLTGQTQYLEIGRQILARLLATQDWSDDPRRRGAVGMSPMYVSLLFFGVPHLLGALAEADIDEPEA
jgi:hypothetical protein